MAHQVGEKGNAPFQYADQDQVAIRIVSRDGLTQLANSGLQALLVH
jgi:hypothetical protein